MSFPENLRVKDPKWVWVGSSIRYNSKSISILAVAETILASCILLYTIFKIDDARFFLISCLIAPLLLLKTKKSTSNGLTSVLSPWHKTRLGNYCDRAVYGSIFFFAARKKPIKTNTAMILYPMAGFVLSLFIAFAIFAEVFYVKITSIFNGFIKHPIISLRRIPKNWLQVCAQTDFSILPEIIPGIERLTQLNAIDRYPQANINFYSVKGYINAIFTNGERDFIARSVLFILFSPCLIGLFLIGIIYRWSLKSTAIFWMVLIFFTRSVFKKQDSLKLRIAEIIDIPWSFLQRVWGVAIIIMHLVIPFLFWKWFSGFTTELMTKAPHVVEFIRFLVVTVLPLKVWHIAAAISAVLTWGLWVVAHQNSSTLLCI